MIDKSQHVTYHSKSDSENDEQTILTSTGHSRSKNRTKRSSLFRLWSKWPMINDWKHEIYYSTAKLK